MMMMQISYGLNLIGLTMGTALLVFAMRNPGKGSWLGKLVGTIVMALTVISLICMYVCAMRGECHKSPTMTPDTTVTAPAAASMEPAKKMEHKHST